MDDIDRLMCAIWAAAMCAGKTDNHGDYFQTYDYFMSMVRGREQAAAAQSAPAQRAPGSLDAIVTPTFQGRRF